MAVVGVLAIGAVHAGLAHVIGGAVAERLVEREGKLLEDLIATIVSAEGGAATVLAAPAPSPINRLYCAPAVNAAALVKMTERQTLRFRYQQRKAEDIGFPDFASPYFFNATSLPESRIERFSAKYEYQAVTSWLRNVSVSAHYQKTRRVLENTLPVQFPAPSATFFPITVFRLNILSDTTQKVTTPGVDVQAVPSRGQPVAGDRHPHALRGLDQRRHSHLLAVLVLHHRHALHGAQDAAAGDHLVAALHGGQHRFHLPLLLLLRADQQEIEDAEDGEQWRELREHHHRVGAVLREGGGNQHVWYPWGRSRKRVACKSGGP